MSDGALFPATVYYASDGYNTSGPKLMGRQAAGQGFLRAYSHAAMDSGRQGSAWLSVPTRSGIEGAKRDFKRAGLVGDLAIMSGANPGALGSSGCLYVPQPGLADLAAQRIRVGERSFSLCGVTHTTASHGVMSTLAQLPLAPVRPWDAVICTSTSVLASVTKLLESQFEYLRWKLGATRFELPQLPVIPLGVHTEDFVFTDQEKADARAHLGIAPGQVAVLFVGRLSFHAKAHPHPMLLALEEAAHRTGHDVHLIQAGWFANDAVEEAFKEAASFLAPRVQHHYLDARDLVQRNTAWAAADVFCSFSDNIQETFGLTPIEAMAAGLPVVVSDWDGYKDTVRHGIDGFRVRTHMPADGSGPDLATLYERGFDNYDVYCGKVCEFVAVDVGQACETFSHLIGDPALRLRMGQAGRTRAMEVYDWKRVIQRYQDLWSELADLREAPSQKGPIPLRHAVDRPDPFELFSSYPSALVTNDTKVALRRPFDEAEFESTRGLGVHKYAASVLPTWDQAEAMYRQLVDRPRTVRELLQGQSSGQLIQGRRHILWMMKVGWLDIAE